ncbi:uncharacterized protein LOC144706595 [Wolffia australiana]
MASPPRRHLPPPSSPSAAPKPLPLEAEITVVSAKHLKNVNWRRGELKPCAVLYIDPENRVTTKADDAGSTRPVWNERFVLPVPQSGDVVLTLEILHAKPSETSKPLVGTARASLWDLVERFPDGGGSSSVPIRSLELRRPSGRPQGKVRIKVNVREVSLPEPSVPSDYHVPPPPPTSFYYSSAPPPPPVCNYHGYAPPTPPPYAHSHPPPAASQYPGPGYPQYQYTDPGYYSGAFYSAQPPPPPPPPPRSYYDAASVYGAPGGPSAPADYPAESIYDQKPRDQGKLGSGHGSTVGAVSGSFSGLSLQKESKYKEEKPVERSEESRLGRDDYSDRRQGY